jgi:hypothetical protein
MEPQLQGPLLDSGLETGIPSVAATWRDLRVIRNSLLLNWLDPLPDHCIFQPGGVEFATSQAM